jgi:hypothetical protein
MYIEKPEHLKDVLTNLSVPLKIICEAYRYCVLEGLRPIESLHEEEKRELFETAKKWLKDKIPEREKVVDLCKAIYLLKNIQHEPVHKSQDKNQAKTD